MTKKITSNNILYSSYQMHHSTTDKIQKSNNTFHKDLLDSTNYYQLIDDFYNNLKKKEKEYKKYKKHPKLSPLSGIINLIISLVNEYNDFYKKLLNYKTFSPIISPDLVTKVINIFEFNLNQIGITHKKGFLKINLPTLKSQLKKSVTSIDFIFEKQGLIDHFEHLKHNHINKII